MTRLAWIWPKDSRPANQSLWPRYWRLRDVLTNRGPDIHVEVVGKGGGGSGGKKTRKVHWSGWSRREDHRHHPIRSGRQNEEQCGDRYQDQYHCQREDEHGGEDQTQNRDRERNGYEYQHQHQPRNQHHQHRDQDEYHDEYHNEYRPHHQHQNEEQYQQHHHPHQQEPQSCSCSCFHPTTNENARRKWSKKAPPAWQLGGSRRDSTVRYDFRTRRYVVPDCGTWRGMEYCGRKGHVVPVRYWDRDGVEYPAGCWHDLMYGPCR